MTPNFPFIIFSRQIYTFPVLAEHIWRAYLTTIIFYNGSMKDNDREGREKQRLALMAPMLLTMSPTCIMSSSTSLCSPVSQDGFSVG